MTRHADLTWDRLWVVLAHGMVTLALAVPLTVASELGLAGAVVVGVVAALLVALAGLYGGPAPDVRSGLPARSTAPGPALSSRIPDPIRHPLRPRAPGPA
jgi:hypothetical protein